MSAPAPRPAGAPKLPAEPTVHPTAKLREARLGAHVEIHHYAQVEYSTIGDFSYVQEFTQVSDADVGKFVSIAAQARINAPNHPMDRAAQHRFTYVPEYYWPGLPRDHTYFAQRRASRCVIGADTWIGHGSVILPGLNIGPGAVIAAGAVVTRDVAPYMIVAGVPARPVRERFSRSIADRLLALAWWDWSSERLAATVDDFRKLSIEAFLEKYEAP